MKLRDAILEEVERATLRVPELYDRLRSRADLNPARRFLLWMGGRGMLYVWMPAMEEQGLVERVLVGDVLPSGLRCTAWRKARLRDRMRGEG